MAWQLRHNRWYYYRTRKVAGRVVTEYCGAGPEAEQAAFEDRLRRFERAYAAHERREERDRLAGVERPALELGRHIDLLARASLLAAGYRQHDHGDWRNKQGTRP